MAMSLREVLLVREENWWINPKSGVLEHLALKYLNFSTEEWVQMNLPSQEELQMRQAHVLPLANASALLAKAEQLLAMSSWPEMVVGIGLTTGRSLVEILHTGHFTQKSAYSILFAGPFTVYERLCDPDASADTCASSARSGCCATPAATVRKALCGGGATQYQSRVYDASV